jgi:hypothetical protein
MLDGARAFMIRIHSLNLLFSLGRGRAKGDNCKFGGAGGIIMICESDHFEPSITGVLALPSCGPETGFKAKFSLS